MDDVMSKKLYKKINRKMLVKSAVKRSEDYRRERASHILENDISFKQLPQGMRERTADEIMGALFFYGNFQDESNNNVFLRTEHLVEDIYREMETLPDFLPTLSFRPFKDIPGLFEKFSKTISSASADAGVIENGLKNLSDNFIVTLNRADYVEHDDIEDVDVYATTDRYTGEITLYRPFFEERRKAERLKILNHEMTHVLQTVFPFERKFNTKTKKEYYENGMELQAIGNELYSDILFRINQGKITSLNEVVDYLNNDFDIQQMSVKNAKKITRKIIRAVVPRFGRMGVLIEDMLGELKMPSEDVNVDIITQRKQQRQKHIEDIFVSLFFDVIRDLKQSPQEFINRFHLYVSEGGGRDTKARQAKRRNDITISEILNFLRFMDVEEDYAKVANVMKLGTQARILELRDRMETDLFDRLKRIWRGTTSDETHAGISHAIDVKKRYDAMKIRAIKSKGIIDRLLGR